MPEIIYLESGFSILGPFVFKAVLVMVLIALAAVATPYIAKHIDKNRKPSPPDEKKAEDGDGVHSIFEKSELEDFDPNYKIYNTDIYGVEKKNGKKQ
ncbi:MAG: hypothetical protein J6A55_07230 [Oscillospiraceae bacterium]|nr:hypothetical protein [Oscillospiraceae bacterium]